MRGTTLPLLPGCPQNRCLDHALPCRVLPPQRDQFRRSDTGNSPQRAFGAGHDVRVIDLYREGFNPVLSSDEWSSYISDTGKNISALHDHVTAMQWRNRLS